MFRTKVVEKLKTHTFVLQLFLKIVSFEIMWKNIIEAERPQMTMYYNACSLHAGYLRLQTHTQCV